MAIEPFRQRIGIASPGSLISGSAPQVSDVGSAIRGVGMDILQAAQPTLRRKAIEAGEQAAGAAVIQRDAQGNVIKIERPAGGGELFNAAFDKVAETRYLNQVSYDFQNALNTEVNDRRVGKDGKAFDPDQFDAAVQGRLEGVLETVDPTLRPAVEGELFREALERTRAFRDEWGRTIRDQTIAGAKDQIEVLLNGYANYRNERLNPTQAYQKYGAPLDRLIIDLRDAGRIGPEQAEALLMRVDNLVTSVEDYAISMSAATGIIPLINGMSKTDVEIFGNWLRNAPDPRKLSGIITNGFSEEKVTPEVIKETWKSLFPNLGEPNSVDRPPEHKLSVASPTSYHNTKNGGRAIDVEPIKGMTFKEYVQIWKDNGFDVIEALEEVGPKRSQFATGDHWHLAFGNTRKVTEIAENPGLQLLDSEQVMALDPSVKQSLLAIVANREQAIREEEAIARAAAAEAERQRRDEERNQKLISSITGALSNGMGGNWSAEQKGAFEESFSKFVDLARMGDPNMQATALRFIQTNQYVPESLVNYMTNGVRSGDWRSAVQLYRNIKGATVGGATVGDLLVDGIDPRSKALLTTADDLIASGQPDSVVSARIEQLRSGNGFTVDEAKAEYTRILGRGREGSYRQARDQKIREVYGIPANNAIPPALARRIDDSFAASLDTQNRDPEKALNKAFEQNKGVYTKSGVFFEGVGPTSLTRTYTQQQLADFFVTIRSNGKRLLPPVKGTDGVVRNHSIGAGGTIKLVPIDNNIGGIGRYEVRVFDPANKSNLINTFQIDLGSELNKWASTQPKKPAGPNPIEEARKERQDTQNLMETIAPPERSRSVSGPKM